MNIDSILGIPQGQIDVTNVDVDSAEGQSEGEEDVTAASPHTPNKKMFLLFND